MEQPDIIKVEVTHEEEVQADHADLFVTIKGTSLVTGEAALTKAREVSQLVTDLTTFGTDAADIHLEGVHAEVTSGILSKTSSAHYSLRIRCQKLEALADVLGVITTQKNTTLSYIKWGYPDEGDVRDAWLVECIQRANEKARKIAEGLGVRLVGVHTFAESYNDPESAYQPMPAGAFDEDRMMVKRRQRVTSEDLGMEVSHAKKVTLRIEVQYRVSEFEQ